MPNILEKIIEEKKYSLDLIKKEKSINTLEKNIKNQIFLNFKEAIQTNKKVSLITEIKKVSNFWESMGSKVKIMSDEDHDKILTFTSHLPHVVAYNIVKTSMSNDEKVKGDIIKYSAGGLRDFTRIAASDPIMWRDIFIDNSALIIQAIDKFIKNLDEFKKAISDKDSKKLIEIFEKSKDFRKSVIKAGQDTDEPDFGRK